MTSKVVPLRGGVIISLLVIIESHNRVV